MTEPAFAMSTPATPASQLGSTASITLVFVDDVDLVCERAIAAGGSVVTAATDHDWGLRQAVVADPQGQRWEPTQRLREVAPADWGAVVAA